MNRVIFVCIFTLCVSLLGFGYFLEYVQDLEPCPLCILQRLAYFIIAMIALLALLHHPAQIGERIYAGVLSLVALLGAGIAIRQVWLQHLPADQVPECGPSLEYMLETFPLFEVIATILTGSGECAEVSWRFLGFSIAEWSLFWLTCLIFISVWMLLRRAHHKAPS